jgi:hypothetical protein
MNYVGDDYVMGHILRFARRTGVDTLTIDFVKGEGGPPQLFAPPISETPARYTQFFWDLVSRHGSDRSCIKAATLTLRYDLATNRPLPRNDQFVESPYTCDVRITDIRGKDYVAHFHAWWYPERSDQSKDTSPWWKFWILL